MPNSSQPLDSRRLYLRLLGYVRPYWLAFVVAIGCMGLSSIVEPVFPAVMKSLLDNGFTNAQNNWDWLIYPLGILAIFVARARSLSSEPPDPADTLPTTICSAARPAMSMASMSSR